MDLENDSYINELIINRELSHKTATLYIHDIGLYCRLIELTPEELIDEAINEFHKHPSQRKIRKHLLKWKNYLLKEPYAQSTRKKMFDHIRYFYQEFEIETPQKIRMKAGKDKQITIKDLPTISDLRLALNNTNLRTQAIILLMCSSGLSKIDVRNLTYQDFLNSIENTFKPTVKGVVDIGELTQNLKDIDVVATWEGYRLKNEEKPVKYITFHTPEATRAIVSYLQKDPPKRVENKRVSNHIRNQSLKKAYFEFVNSVNKCLFCSLKSLTASFHALFIGSLSNFNRARVLKTFRSCVNTVADVLVSSSFTFTKTTFAPPMFLCSYISSFNNIIFSLFYVLCAKEPYTQSINSMKNNLTMTKRFQFLSLRTIFLKSSIPSKRGKKGN